MGGSARKASKRKIVDLISPDLDPTPCKNPSNNTISTPEQPKPSDHSQKPVDPPSFQKALQVGLQASELNQTLLAQIPSDLTPLLASYYSSCPDYPTLKEICYQHLCTISRVTARAILVDQNNNILTLENNRHNINLFSQRGERIRCIQNEVNWPFKNPVAMKFGLGGDLLVLDREDSVGEWMKVFTYPEFNKTNEFYVDGSHDTFAIDRTDGTIFLPDSKVSCIIVLSAVGEIQTFWGRLGSGPGEFQKIVGIDIDPDRNLYVSDQGNNRIQILDREGNFLRQIKLNTLVPGMPELQIGGIAVDKRGKIVISEKQMNFVQVLSPEGTTLMEIPARDAQHVVIGWDGCLITNDGMNNRIFIWGEKEP